MLTAEQNAELTRVGPGTPMGELLRRSARSHRWRTLVRYPPGAGSAPRQFVSDWSRRDHPLGLDGLEIRLAGDRDAPIVQARAVSKKATGTPVQAAPSAAQDRGAA